MNRIFTLIAGLCISASVVAAPSGDGDGKKFVENDLSPISPTYMDDIYQGSGWDSNWFVSLKGGLGSFIGKPVGCGDFYDRSNFLLNVSAGKWFTTKVGGRISFQGLTFTDSQLRDCDYQSIHADFLYNLAPVLISTNGEQPKWGIIPYLGCGIVHNSYNGMKPFGISYGLIGEYAINDRLSVSAEIGNTTTLGDFDGIGNGSKFNDHLFQASVGVTVNIGKTGWKRVIDAKPYIYQNDILIRKLQELYASGGAGLQYDSKTDAYCDADAKLGIDGNGNGKNNYSGLNSLRMRMANAEMAKVAAMSVKDSIPYFAAIRDGNYIGAPIMFFFRFNSTKFTDPSQIINLDMIAKVIHKYNLKVKIIGAADSRTGKAKGNRKISDMRASYLGKLLMQRGVEQADIELVSRGGIDKYDPYWSNRHTCIMLYLK